jgi:heme oxygenase (biliverdin-IX-beta and delta-forming)
MSCLADLDVSMPHTPRRWLLRESTAGLHQAVDDAVGHFESLSQYRIYVRDMSAFRLPIEQGLVGAQWPSAFGGWRPTTIGDAIERDLGDLDIAIPSASNASTPQGAEEMLGVLYVLEGSTLGARLLYGRAQDIGLGKDFGARHLAVQSAGVEQWRGFLDVLEAAPDLDMDRVIAASRMTFQQAQAAFKSGHI